MKESRTVETDVDERRLHAGQHSGHAPQVNVADRGTVVTSLDVELAQYAVSDEANPRLADVDVDQKSAVAHVNLRKSQYFSKICSISAWVLSSLLERATAISFTTRFRAVSSIFFSPKDSDFSTWRR